LRAGTNAYIAAKNSRTKKQKTCQGLAAKRCGAKRSTLDRMPDKRKWEMAHLRSSNEPLLTSFFSFSFFRPASKAEAPVEPLPSGNGRTANNPAKSRPRQPPRSRAERSGPPGAKRKGAKRSGCPATRRPTSPKRGERPRLGGELFEPRAGHYRPRRVESRPKRGHETSGNNQKPKAPPPQATNWPPCSAACACRAAGEAHGKPPIPPKRAPTALK